MTIRHCHIAVQEADFDPGAEIDALRAGDGGVGAVASFVGTVRAPHDGTALQSMWLEHYPGMTEAAIAAMCEQAFQRFALRGVRVIHRVGRLHLGERIVLVAVSAAHRGMAFQGCEFLMDYLKTQAPFWKKEHTDRGAQWVDAREADDAALARWGVVAGNAPVAAPATPPPPAIEATALRQALGRYATGVTIITCADAAGQWTGLTANSFSSLSLAPPLVLWSLREASPSLQAFAAAPHFAINVLAESQVDLSRRFASRVQDKFAEGAWSAGAHGAPILAGCAAVFECETVSMQAAGDHQLFIGRVLACSEAPLPPLVFRSGHYHLLGEVL